MEPTKIDTEINPSFYFTDRKQLKSPRKFNNQDNNLNEPKMIGYFSVNEHREFMPDASQLRYLKLPKDYKNGVNLNLDVKNGHRWKPESVKREKMDFLLRFIVNNIEELKAKNQFHGDKLLDMDVICSRGRLVQIMCPQHIKDKAWSLIVSKYKGNVYICQPDGEDFHTKQTEFGFKFEQFLLSGRLPYALESFEAIEVRRLIPFSIVANPVDDPITDTPVIESEEFYGVFRNKVGNVTLLYNAEIDGLDSEIEVDLSKADLSKLNFVELKTCIGEGNGRWCRWWAHSYLAGVSSLAVGYRTQGGTVTKIKRIATDDLTRNSEVKK